MKKFFFDGDVFHRRVKGKNHKFLYPYKSFYLENFYNFDEKRSIVPISNYFRFNFFKEKEFLEIIRRFEKFAISNGIKFADLNVSVLKTPDNPFFKSFNPVSFWILFKKTKVIFLLSEVKNTFFEKQLYEIHNKGEEIDSNYWYEETKKMYVSPFSEKKGFYKFKISSIPFSIKINQYNSLSKLEVLTELKGKLIERKFFNKIYYYFFISFNSVFVMIRIHWQALRLWIKKLKVTPHGGNGYAE